MVEVMSKDINAKIVSLICPF